MMLTRAKESQDVSPEAWQAEIGPVPELNLPVNFLKSVQSMLACQRLLEIPHSIIIALSTSLRLFFSYSSLLIRACLSATYGVISLLSLRCPLLLLNQCLRLSLTACKDTSAKYQIRPGGISALPELELLCPEPYWIIP
jgi:hypothetical protein